MSQSGHIRVKAGSYYAVWFVRDAAGRRVQRSKGGFRLKRDAREFLTETLAAIQGGTYTEPSKKTVGQYITEDWLPSLDARVAAGKLRPNTVAWYRRLASKHILDHRCPPRSQSYSIAGVPLQAVTGENLDKLYGHLLDHGHSPGRGLSKTTVHGVHVTLSKALGDAVDSDKLASNVAAKAKAVPQPDSNEAEIWSPRQLLAFLAHIEGDRLAAMWALFAMTGLRRSEVAGLRWEFIDFDNAEVLIRKTRVVVDQAVFVSEPKSKKSRRSIHLDPATVAALRAHRLRQREERMAAGPVWEDSGLVFVKEDGSPIHPDWITRRFHSIGADAGLPRLRGPHGLRHSYATAALEAGEDIKYVSELLGHSSIGITGDTYQHVTERLNRQSAGRVASFITGASSVP